MASDSGARHRALFRFHAELNAFLSLPERDADILYRFPDNPGIKDPIEALGIPHTEVGLILVNGTSVDFRYHLQDSDRVDVYPVATAPDTGPSTPLRDPLPAPAFVLDVHLGKLARLLRLLGFDSLYRNDFDDPQLVTIAVREQRALLTRDRRLLFHRRIVHGHYLHSTRPLEQAREVLDQFRLRDRAQPFSRCLQCNGPVDDVSKTDVEAELEPATSVYYQRFRRCRNCGRIYWRGSHMRGLHHQLQAMLSP